MIEVHDRLQHHGSQAKVVAKIERPEALEDIHAIVKSADGIMVARGDLGLETDFADVPLIQKRLIALCRHYARPVITATQMLDSMVEHPKPTRAEASDVANAILDGSDAIMLSNETAAGKHPIEAVQVLGRIAQSCETDGAISGDSNWPHDLSDSAAISEAAARMATRLQARRIVVYTQSGDTARLMARYRLPIPIVAVTATSSTYNQLALSFGVEPYLMPNIRNMDELLKSMNGLALQQGWAEVGDPIVIVSGFDRIRGVIDTLHVHRVTPTN